MRSVISMFLLIVSAAALAQDQRPPAFRAGALLVPIDVRVVDGRGEPIADLRREDFTVTEDRVPQRIEHFLPYQLTAEAPDPSSPHRIAPADGGLKATNRRVFLIVFGSGRLQGPSKGIDGAERFVHESLLPQDLVGVFAYNRATPLTTDHARIAEVIRRFGERNEQLEQRIRQHFSVAWSMVYQGTALPPSWQAEIDSLFSVEGGAREPITMHGGALAGVDADNKQVLRRLVEAEQAAIKASMLASMGMPSSPFDDLQSEIAKSMAGGLTLGQFASVSRQGHHDLGRLYTAIDYLKYVDGEKHIIYITENGMYLPRLENDLSLAAAANSARVTISAIQTGGLNVAPGADREPLVQRTIISSLRSLAELTGGSAAFYEDAARAFDRVAKTTQAGYLLGYYVATPPADGRFRRIEVSVNRRGARVLARRGYFAEPLFAPADRRRSISYNRIATAVQRAADVSDVRFTLRTSETHDDKRRIALGVEAAIDASRVGFLVENGLHHASLDIAVFCQDGEGEPVGYLWQTMNLKLGDASYQRVLEEGIRYTGVVTVQRPAHLVKVVVFDYGSDRIGSITRQVR